MDLDASPLEIAAGAVAAAARGRISKAAPSMTGDDCPHNFSLARRSHAAPSRVKQIPGYRVNQVAPAKRLPVQPIGRIQDHLSGMWCSGDPVRRAKHDLYYRFARGPLLRRNNHRWVISVTRVESPDVPGVHRSSMPRSFLVA